MENATVKPFILPYLEMVITTICNRLCKSCSNFIPYIRHKAKHVRADEVKNQIECLKKLVGTVERFQVHGGEPLLNPELPEIMRAVLDSEFIKEIRIATNGTIIPSIELLQVLSSTRAKLAISDYYFNKSTAPIIQKLCDKWGVECIMYGKQLWYEFGKSKGIIFETCPINCYPVLYNWKIYLCARICHAYSGNGKKYCIDIRDNMDLRVAFDNNILKEGCYMCNISNKLIEPGF